ncbi:MAG: hypothetical protein WBM81_16735 [Sedimenticolaceae bacterium]
MSEMPLICRGLGIAMVSLLLAWPVRADSERPLFDPTRPGGWQASGSGLVESTKQPLGALTLQGTFSQAGVRSAMISGRRVSVGDEISGAEVIEIDKHKVTLQIGGETVELASVVPEVKSPADVKGDGR